MMLMDAFVRCGFVMPKLVALHMFKLLGGIPGTWFDQSDWNIYYKSRLSVVEESSLHWRRVDLKGVIGPQSKKPKLEEKKQKQKLNAKGAELLSYFDSAGVKFTAHEVDMSWSEFVFRLQSERELCSLIIDELGRCNDVEAFCVAHDIPLFTTKSPLDQHSTGCLVGVLATSMYAGQTPLLHSGFTGGVIRGFKEFVESRTSREIEWFSNDVVIQPSDMQGDLKCLDCGCVLFPKDHWWHLYCDDCNCGVCVSIRNGCQGCFLFNQAFAVYGRVARQWEWKTHNPSFSLLFGSNAKIAIGRGELEVLHPGVVLGKETSDDMIQPFWCSLVSATERLVAGVNCSNGAPMAPSDQIVLYRMIKAAEKGFPKVPSIERALLMEKLLSSKKMPSNKGTFGMSSANGRLRDKVDKTKKKDQEAVKEVVYSSSVRRLIPLVMSIRDSSFAKAHFGQFGNERLMMYGASFLNASRGKTSLRWGTDVFGPLFKTNILPHLDLASLKVCLCISKAFRQHAMDVLRAIDKAGSDKRADYYGMQRQVALEQRELFSQLVVHRLHPIHAIYNKLRVLGMLAHELRAVGAVDSVDMPVFDRTRSKNLLMELVAEQPVESSVLLSKYGIHQALHSAFEKLRQFGRKHVFEPARALGLAGGAEIKIVAEEDFDDDDDVGKVAKTGPFKSIFVTSLGDDMVTRLDVPARSQVVSILRTLLFIFSEGVSNNAFLSVYFAFSSSMANFQDELGVVEADDENVHDAASAAQTDAADGESFLNDDFVPLDEVDAEKPRRSSAEVLLTRARLAYQVLHEHEKVLLRRGGQKLQFVLQSLVPRSVYGDAAAAFDRFDAFRKKTSFGVAKARAKSDGEVIRKGHAPFQSECIGTLRDRLFSVLLEHLPDHPGFRLAPLPSQAVALRLRASEFEAFPALRRYIAGALSEEEKVLFPKLYSSKLDPAPTSVTLSSLFDIGGFSNGAKVNSVYFNGGSYISAFSMNQKKASATRLLKANPDGVKLDALFGSPKERAEASAKAKETAAKRGANVDGPDCRVPVSKKRGCVTEERFFDNMEKLRHKADDKEENENRKRTVQSSAQQQRRAFFKASVSEDAPPKPPPDPAEPIQFVVKLQSNKDCWMHAELLLEWLKDHPLVVLDPGKRWVVRGIIARFVDGTINRNDGSVSLAFMYRGLRVSGRAWNYCQKDVGVPVEDFKAELEKSVESVLERMTEKEFLQSDDQIGDLSKIFASASFACELDESCSRLLDGRAVRRKEKRLKHQGTIALNFCRKISRLCEGFGDPIVIMGAAGGNGGRGRAQVNHDLLLKTLAGFFTVIMVDEHCTSKMTPCCHRVAHAPRSKGRSRGCKECRGDGRTHWWDRDAGAAWNMLSIYLSLLLTGERPAAMTKVNFFFFGLIYLGVFHVSL